jgi:cytochrome c2
MRRIIQPVLFAALLVSSVLQSAASHEAVKRGEAVAARWCSTCHVQAGSAPDADMAPPFEDIVKRPGRTSAYLRKFLDEDHFPMTTFRLFPHEKDDVVIYLNALRQP